MSNVDTIKLSNKFISISVIWLIILLGFSFPISASLPIILNLGSSTPLNIFLRASYLTLSIFLIFYVFYKQNKIEFSLPCFFLICFWIIYLIRLIYDISYRGIVPSLYSPFYVYSISIGSIFIPVITIILCAKYIDFKKLVNLSYLIIIISNILILISYTKYNSLFDIFLQRAILSFDDFTNPQKSSLDPISIGKAGELLTLLSIIFIKKAKNLKLKFLNIILFFIGLTVLISGGSRGPFISFFFIIIMLFFSFNKKINFLKLIFSSLFLLSLFVILFYSLEPYLNDLPIYNRLNALINLDFLFDESLFNRSNHFFVAFNQFINNPIFGDQFILSSTGGYPHNILLEVLMSLGIFGALIFYPIFLIFLFKTYILMKSDNLTLKTLSIFSYSVFFSAMLSANLYSFVPFWIIFTLILSINKIYYD